MNPTNRFGLSKIFVTILALSAGAVYLPGATSETEAAAVAAKPAPAWTLKDLDGHDVSSEQFKGKVVVLDFWATWCGPCIGEIPGYVELQNKYGKDGLVIIGALSHDPKPAAKIKEFVGKNGMNYKIVVSTEAVEDAFGGFNAIPTTFLIGRDGRIIHQKTGAMAHDKYEELVRQALN